MQTCQERWSASEAVVQEWMDMERLSFPAARISTVMTPAGLFFISPNFRARTQTFSWYRMLSVVQSGTPALPPSLNTFTSSSPASSTVTTTTLKCHPGPHATPQAPAQPPPPPAHHPHLSAPQELQHRLWPKSFGGQQESHPLSPPKPPPQGHGGGARCVVPPPNSQSIHLPPAQGLLSPH